VNSDSKVFAGGTHLPLVPPLKLYWAVHNAAGGLWICLTLSLIASGVELDKGESATSLNKLAGPLSGGNSVLAEGSSLFLDFGCPFFLV
jgi:hypothetical protein